MLTPDYIRLGNRVCVVTWARLLSITGIFLFWGLMSSSSSSESDSIVGLSRVAGGGLGGGMLSRVVARVTRVGGGGKRRGSTKGANVPLSGLMRTFCAAKTASATSTISSSSSWSPTRASAGVTAENDCDWSDTNKAAVPFRTCTFPRAEDSQVSAYVHREGYWNEWRMKIVEDMLPIIDSEEAWNLAEGRTLTIDVSANFWRQQKLCDSRRRRRRRHI